MKKNNKSLKNKIFSYRTLVAFVIVISIALVGLIIYELNAYEQGVLEVYGSEQDGYVETTLDQIDRLGDQATQEEITNIIASLDSTASKYWMLSTGDNILFVKSVTETNRYKNFTASTYYDSASATKFVNNLKLNRVTHQIVELDDGTYMTSGGIFEWNGVRYKICLMTLDHAILDKNDLLEAKNAIIAFSVIIVAILMSIIMILTRRIIKQQNEESAKDKNIVILNQRILALDERLKRIDAYSASNHIFDGRLIKEFIDKLQEKEIQPLCYVFLDLNADTNRRVVYEQLQILLDDNVLRFKINEDIFLIFAGYSEERCRQICNRLEKHNVKLKGIYVPEDSSRYYAEYEGFIGEMQVEQ